ncbi:MAG: HAMP domain-containing sensor histidine kinase [Planctomycetota bacterium]
MRADAVIPLAIDALHSHVALVNTDGVVTAINKAWRRFAEANGYADASLGVGENYIELCERSGQPGSSSRVIGDALQSVLNGSLDRFEYEYPCHAPHEKRWFRVQIGGYVDEVGRRAAVLAHENISTLKLSEQRLRHQRDDVQAELDRVRADLVKHTRLVTIGQVAASIAHDLRNPLGAIRNATYLLKKKLGKLGPVDADLERYTTIIDEEINASDQIIAELMSLARGKEPQREPLNAAEFFADVSKRLPQVADAITLDATPGLAFFADPGQLMQVMTNLVTNAVEACDRAGSERRVSVSIREKRDEVIIEVGDTGGGVPEDLRERVFEPLFSTSTRGTGLGLAICRQVVARHGGTIVIDTEPHALGGARVIVELPRHLEPLTTVVEGKP